MSSPSKIDAKQVIDVNTEIISELDNMGKYTKTMESSSQNYQSALQDSIMPEIISLLEEIRDIINDTKAKTQRYAGFKIEGAEALNRTQARHSSKIKKI